MITETDHHVTDSRAGRGPRPGCPGHDDRGHRALRLGARPCHGVGEDEDEDQDQAHSYAVASDDQTPGLALDAAAGAEALRTMAAIVRTVFGVALQAPPADAAG